MALPASKIEVTEDEYLRLDAGSPEKLEFVNGEIVAMSGASPAHSTVQSNLAIAIGYSLRGGPCQLHIADLRVRIKETGLYAYPDLVVFCGAPEWSTTRPASLLNPKVIIEVLSPSTAGYDLDVKAAHYRLRPSVETLLFVDSRRRYVQRQDRQKDGTWRLQEQEEGELSLLGHRLTLAEIYERVTFETSIVMDGEPG